jgi:hypothetical protein
MLPPPSTGIIASAAVTALWQTGVARSHQVVLLLAVFLKVYMSSAFLRSTTSS